MNSVVDRTNGFLDAIKGHGFKIVGQQDAKGNLQVSMGIAEDLLQAHPETKNHRCRAEHCQIF